jgi:murein DD-endopeptidase MepM/ murein hydrolase activator NlpD
MIKIEGIHLKTHKSKIKLILLVIPIICVFIAIGWVLVKKLENEKPTISIDPELSNIKSTVTFNLNSLDNRSGLRHVLVEISQGEKSTILYKKQFSGDTFFPEKNTKFDNTTITIDPNKLGYKDGKAVLQIAVSDFSWRNSLKGNESIIKKEIIIDTHPPAISVLTKAHNIMSGGSGLVIYRLNEVPNKSGVVVDDKYYPGHSGYFKDPNIYLSFFALDYNKKKIDKLYVYATDEAGNKSVAGFNYHIKSKNYAKDSINISDSFLNKKLPEFENSMKFDPNATNIEKYIKVNNEFRKITYNIISELSNMTDKVLHWKGPFLRFSGSPMAGFADDRTYVYHGKIVDRQTHMGVDIASLEHAKVPAANNGKVVLAGAAGIYGNTVVIDHGFGLFSLYGHLSSISVEENQIVSKGDIIGNTGMTGLAGGDHLHFSIIINKTYVNPTEWWDNNWIVNNITSKLDEVNAMINSD